MGTCIVSFYSGWERRGGELPSPSTEALQWLVYWGIKLFGIDTLDGRRLPNYGPLSTNGIPLIE